MPNIFFRCSYSYRVTLSIKTRVFFCTSKTAPRQYANDGCLTFILSNDTTFSKKAPIGTNQAAFFLFSLGGSTPRMIIHGVIMEHFVFRS